MICVAGRHVDVAQDHDGGRTVRAIELDHQLQDLDLIGDVEVGRRLIEQN